MIDHNLNKRRLFRGLACRSGYNKFGLALLPVQWEQAQQRA